jgi:hypothetical protein
MSTASILGATFSSCLSNLGGETVVSEIFSNFHFRAMRASSVHMGAQSVPLFVLLDEVGSFTGARETVMLLKE